MINAPLTGGSAADLLALGLGAADDDALDGDLDGDLDLGEFLCACPELELQGCLGRGGMGVVYRARQVRLDRDVAVKLMSPEVAKDPEFADRFHREAKAMARLQHPGIVGVHDFGHAAGVYYIVMELVDGPNLRQLMAEQLDPDLASRMVGQLCDALAYAHGQGVVHRDIKPENVLIDRDGRVRIADFGLAKLQREAAPGTAVRTRHVLGTPQYMAPEQIRDPNSVDQRSDIFAVGVVFYEMLTGQLPVGRFQSPSELGPGDPALDDIVLRALEANRDRRFQAASEICAALSTIGEAATLTDAVTPKRRAWLPMAAGGLAVAGAVAMAWHLGRGPSEPAAPVEAALVAPVSDVPAAKPAINRARWPVRDLGILDPSVSSVVGVDWAELRQAPVIQRLSAALPQHSPIVERCRDLILKQTNKILIGLTPDATPVDVLIHADWDIAALDDCLTAATQVLKERPRNVEMSWKSEAFGEHRRIKLTVDDKPFTVTVGKRDSRVAVTLRPVTAEEFDAMLRGEATAGPLAERVLEAVDLAAPIWFFAEPEPGLLPMDMVAFNGAVSLWDQLNVDATIEFADKESATGAKVLIESYANVIASLPDITDPPNVTVEQQGRRIKARANVTVPKHLDKTDLNVSFQGPDKGRLQIGR